MQDEMNWIACRPLDGEARSSEATTNDGRVQPLARTSISVIIPTYQEVANLPELLRRIGALRATHNLALEVLLMDDNSQDGSVEAVRGFGAAWARMVVRTTNRGLAAAVTDGLRLARHEVVVVMDADLSHPPESIPALVEAVEAGADIAIGSRYVGGASTDDNWGVMRWINSRAATWLARPLTSAQDPMAGFFALRRSNYQGVHLNAIGYKIGLELIVKCNLKHIEEIPIHFSDRASGESKLSVKQQLLYIQHLRRLYMYKFAGVSELLQFAMVGGSGVVVNLGVLRLSLLAGASEHAAVAAGIGVSIVSNFFLHRRFTFSYARNGNVLRQFLGFLSASSFGAAVSYIVTISMRHTFNWLPVDLAASVGIGAGLGFNFLANRFLVFRKTHGAKVQAPSSEAEPEQENARNLQSSERRDRTSVDVLPGG